RQFARDNKPLGQFRLDGIPPARRGVPQIEVTFDIDANGIVNVSAKDLGTGKEQKVRIEQSSGLSEAEIEKMRKDAEAHADEDRKRKELVETKNRAESMCFELEKMLKEHSDKLRPEDKSALEDAIKRTRDACNSDNADQIKSALNDLEQTSHAMSKALYESAQASQANSAAGQAAGDTSGKKDDDDAIDAEFEVKK
ncbi:MAG: Hsp70 family protein, partial [Thermoguttaceae bacterium]|nr:Hsp70 family protein [Thermoguttaceae bacterium]